MLTINLQDQGLLTRDAVREPQLFRLHNGDLLLTYHVQPDMHFAERRGKRSSDGGRTWRDEPQRAHREQAMGQNARGVVLGLDIHTFECKPGEFLGTYFRSDDDGATFSGPHELRVQINRVAENPGYPEPDHIPPEGHATRRFYQPLPAYYHAVTTKASRRRGPMFWRYLIEHDSRWLTTMACKFHGDRYPRTVLVASEDDGKTWSFVSVVAAVDTEDERPGDGFEEPVLAKVADGTLLCINRRGGHLPLNQTRSCDGGLTWSDPETIMGHGVDPDLLLMSNGVLACTFGRPGRHIMFSEDGCGRTWSDQLLIGGWGGSTYMGIAEVEPGELLVVYDRNDRRGEHPTGGRDPANCSLGSARISVRVG